MAVAVSVVENVCHNVNRRVKFLAILTSKSSLSGSAEEVQVHYLYGIETDSPDNTWAL